jgi:hypothetical protein
LDQEQDFEAAFTFYRYGSDYCAGLSYRIYAWQAASIFKNQKKYRAGERISRWFHPAGTMTDQKIMNMRKKGFYAYSKNKFSRPAGSLRFP